VPGGGIAGLAGADGCVAPTRILSVYLRVVGDGCYGVAGTSGGTMLDLQSRRLHTGRSAAARQKTDGVSVLL